MREFFKMFFASFLAILIVTVVGIALVMGIIYGLSKSVVADKTDTDNEDGTGNTVLVINTENEIHEQGMRNSIAQFSGEPPYQAGLYDLIKAIDNAKDDKRVSGILIKAGGSPNGMATLQQLRTALQDFKGSKKFIYAYGEMIPQKSYYLASVADSVFLNPAGFPELKGIATQLLFFKGTLDKLDIQPEIFYAGKFKSATEPFRTDRMSEPNRQQIKAYQKAFWDEILKAVAAHTKTDTATVNQWTQAGTILFASDALKTHMADRLAYWDEVESLLRKRTDTEVDEEVDYTDIDKYAMRVRSKGTGDDRIAILFAEGSIVDGESEDESVIASVNMSKQITKLRMNDKIRAVVLRVNSPGGSALASEVILRELQLLQKKKPLIVSMGDVAASGGYYISCAADSVFAMPTTITGSIGVFSMLFSMEKLLNNKFGITIDEEKNAPYATFPSVAKPLNANEAARMQMFVDTIYTTFKRRVSVGRKIAETDVDSIAQGRVWSGQDALRIRLVDGLGGLDRALAAAAAKAGLKSYKVNTYPAPADKFESMMRQFGGNTSVANAVAATVIKEMGADYDSIKTLKELARMNGKAQMIMPYRVVVE